ncbi:MAG: DNA methyltransferase, partial [Geminicoccaceae bacterium]
MLAVGRAEGGVTVRILQGDVRDMLATLPDESVHCVVTSPPYWGLRDYGVAGQLGLEPTMGEHIETMVLVFREVRRVLRKDGTVWLNYGDSYAHGGNGSRDDVRWPKQSRNDHRIEHAKKTPDLKPKDLCMIPNRLAIALQEPYHLGPIKKEIDRAWLAGLIDADGCIGIRRQNNGEWNPTYIPYLTVGCSDRLLLERCVDITGLGKVNVKSRAGSTDERGINQRRDGLVWRLDGQIASRVIRDIYPYLVQKKPQALVCNAMNVSQEGGRPTKSKPVPPDIVAYRQRLYESIKALNQRQSIDLPDLPPVKSNVEQGWWVRSEIIWHKPNPMPESVTDRPATAHEKVWLLSKSARYFYDAEVVAENANPIYESRYRSQFHVGAKESAGAGRPNGAANTPSFKEYTGKRNLRNVWTVPTKGFSGAHYAT